LDICAAPWLLCTRKDARKAGLRKSGQRTIRFEALLVGKTLLFKAPPEGEMRRGDFGGCLSAADLPEPTVHQGDDFLLNLRIVQQTQERLFERLVLLCVLDLIFSFGSIFHGASMP
jgi:hypothetical protein